MADTEEKVLTQADIDALVSKVPSKPSPPPAAAVAPVKPPEPVKPKAPTPPPPPILTKHEAVSIQKYTSSEVSTLQGTVTDLIRQVSKMSDAMQRLVYMEERVAKISALLKLSPDAAQLLDDKIDEIYRRLEEMQQNKSALSLQDDFQCHRCQSKSLVAIHVKCTGCGDESWMGWWPKPDGK